MQGGNPVLAGVGVTVQVEEHARVHLGVVLTRQAYGVELEITDDGTGFVLAESRGFGLDGMRKRLAELGGRLTVRSSGAAERACWR